MNALALFTLTLFVVVPGLGAVLAAFPAGRPSVPLAAALVVPFGFAVDGLVGFVLALAQAMRPWTYLPVIVVVTVALWGVGLRRASVRDRWDALRDGTRDQRWTLAVG